MCKRHAECETVRATGHLLEIISCPWCGFAVATGNPFKWCAGCYVLYHVERGWAHFSKSFRPTMAQAWAIALAKSGGAPFGRLTLRLPDGPAGGIVDNESHAGGAAGEPNR